MNIDSRLYRRWVFVGILFLGAVIIWNLVFWYQEKSLLKVSFLDVGQGDAILIESPSGNQVLIDGGKGRQILRVLGQALPFYDRSLDLVIATHPDADHIGGLPFVFERYEVSGVLDNGQTEDAEDFQFFSASAQKETDARFTAHAGQQIDLGDGVKLDILFPQRDMQGMETNRASVVVKLTYKETEFLLTGDLPSEIETYLAQNKDNNLTADVLKLGHHGSRTSSSEIFLKTVNPQYAVVSAGRDNRYGHPHQEVLARLKDMNIFTASTAKQGTIEFISDGYNIVCKKCVSVL
ncbi:MAG: competence protein ComEC [Patescibacteria group bacterium]|nr:competence protein ComEC [Patescibacteria group bacterium]